MYIYMFKHTPTSACNYDEVLVYLNEKVEGKKEAALRVMRLYRN